MTETSATLSDSDLRLQACALVRQREDLLDDVCKESLAVAERFARGEATEDERDHACVRAMSSWSKASENHRVSWAAWSARASVRWVVGRCAVTAYRSASHFIQSYGDSK